MGKKHCIYLDSELSDEFDCEEEKSKTVSRLLKKHYSESISAIEACIAEQEAELRRTRKKLRNKLREAKAGAGGAKSRVGGSGLYDYLKNYPVGEKK